MGTVMNGNKWSGVYVNGSVVSGLVKNGVVFYKKRNLGYFLVEYTDINSVSHSNNFSNESDLLLFTKMNKNLRICKVSSVNNISIKDCNIMFGSCSSLTTLDLSSFNTSNVKNMGQMFRSCSSLTILDLSNFNTSNVTNMSYMFGYCSSLTTLDLSSFNTSNVKNMGYMFRGCSSLTTLDLSSFDFSNVTFSSGMLTDIPSNCLIKVKDQAAKDFVLGSRRDLTNVVIV